MRHVTQESQGKKTAGLDGQVALTPAQRVQLVQEMADHTLWQARPARRVYIPKARGKLRPLGIPTVEDRLLQRAVARILSAIYEPEFLEFSFGYRPGRNPHLALKALRDHIVTGKVRHVYEADIEGYFTNLNHEWLRRMSSLRIADPVITGLSGKWLKAGVMEHGVVARPDAGTPQGGPSSPLLALIALHGMDEAITRVYPRARVIAYADDCVVLHEDRQVLEHCQQLLMTWLAKIGLTLNEAKSRISHTLEGDQPGFSFLGFHIRQYRVGKYHSGKGPDGHHLGYKTLMKPAKANIKAHLAESGQIIRRSKALPQSELIHQLNPKIRGWANYSRVGGSQAAYARLDQLIWVKLRSWAHRRHPTKTIGWVLKRYWHRIGTRRAFATPPTSREAVYLHTHSEVAIKRHVKVQGNRSPYDGDWVYWSSRQGRHPSASPRRAKLLKTQQGRCRYCGLFFQHDDRIEVDHIDGNRRDSRYANLQALHGHCHDAKTREQGDYLPPGMRDKHRDTEERRERKPSCADLEQRQAE